MKPLMIIASLCMVGCATHPTDTSYVSPKQQTIPYEEIANFKIIDSRDCPRANQLITTLDEQLRLKGLTNVDPEKMSKDDRWYNEKAKVIKWSLIVGCNNPNRYAKK